MQARSGMMRAQGGDDEPVFHQIAVNDTATAMMAAFAILAALHARETTGRGQEIQTCLANQSVLFQSGELTWYEGRPPSPIGGRDFLGFSALRRFYQCADGWIGIAAANPEQFQPLAAALGHAEWAGRMTAERVATEPANGELAGRIAAALEAMPVADVLDRLLARGVPAAPARRHEELFTDHWLAANGFFRGYDDPQFGHIRGITGYADWGRSIGGFPRRAPAVGEHTREILEEFGMGAIAPELFAKGVVAGG
jgi:crotonobetainyl-CoA:carnitine CoA-transferase CaiB-like acyl-CoA transferase